MSPAAADDFGPRVTGAYAADGPALDLGRGMFGLLKQRR